MDNRHTDIASRCLTPIPTDMEPGGTLKQPVKCLLCDVYGTLFISGSGDIGTSKRQTAPLPELSALLDRYGIARPAEELLEKLHSSIESHHVRSKALGVDHPEVKIDEIWARILGWKSGKAARPFARDFEMIMNPVWPMPGLDRMLKTCRDTGTVMGIISNAQFFTLPLFHRFMNAGVQALGFHPNLLILSYRHGMAKPSSGLFQLAVSRLRHMGIDAADTAFIGNDMGNDIAPAVEAGFQTILFAGDARSLRLRSDMPRCIGIQPDLVVTHLDQVVPFIVESATAP